MTSKRWLIPATPVLVCVALIWSYLASPTLPVVTFKEYRRIGSFNLPVFSITNPADSDYFRGLTKYEVLVNSAWQQTYSDQCVFEHFVAPFPSHQSVEVVTAPHIPKNATKFRVGFAITPGDPCHVSLIARIAATLRIPIGDLTSIQIWSAAQDLPPTAPPAPSL